MPKILIVTGDGGESYEALYAVHRFQEAGWETAVAAPSKRRLHFTVTRTSSEPAKARAATCSMVPATSAVSVLVIDCTTTGTSQPTRTCPMLTVAVFLR